MSDTDIYLRKALNKHLNAMTPTISIVWENTNFTATNGVGYLETWLLPVPTKPITLGSAYWEEFTGIFQITCVYPSGRGNKDAVAKASKVREYFKRGTVCTYNTLTVKPTESTVASGYYSDDGSWYRIPISITYKTYDHN